MIMRSLVLLIIVKRMLTPWLGRSVFLPRRSPRRIRKTLILFLSGAGGWVKFDRKLTAEFQAQGFDVLGMNSLRYFLWRERSPQELTASIEAQVRHRMAAWEDERLIMVGYSQGADVLPFVVARLSPVCRSYLKCLVLLGPAPLADFHLRLRDVISNRYSLNARPLLPELRKISVELPVFCITGEADPHAKWWMQPQVGIRSRLVSGSHIFRNNAPEISRLIREEIESVP
jgi:type IV secretory pathway VirJ component